MTINVTMTQTRCAGGAVYHVSGQSYDLADAVAEQYIYNGWATYNSGRSAGVIAMPMWVGTQEQYDALAVKDAGTVYNIVAS